MPAEVAQAIFRVLALLIMLFSLFGLILPIYPGLVVIWLMALIEGLLNRRFDLQGMLLFGLITLLMITGSVIDNVIIAARTRQQGASWLSLFLSFAVGVIVSLIFTPLLGLPATLLALFLAEYVRSSRDAGQAWMRFKAMLGGWGLAQGVRFLIGLGMILLWVLWAW
jgi:uncharacterized protein YqgC (DUF456 family)